MDRVDLDFGQRLRLALQTAIHRVSEAARSRFRWRLSPGLSRRVIGGSLLVLGAAGANWAHDLAREETLAEWKRAHSPSQAVWRHALGARDFRLVGEEKFARQALRTLPQRLDSQGVAWVSVDRGWVVVFPGPTIHARVPKDGVKGETMPKSWDPGGPGWTGFETILDLIDKSPKPAVSPSKKKAAPYRDPREIVY